MGGGTSIKYYPSDHLGSTNLVTDSSGDKLSELRYNPWGEVRSTWTKDQVPGLPTDYTYTGQRSYMDDPTTTGAEGFGLMFYNARWYDSALGRFAQADTIVPTQSQGVQAWDRYAYVNNSPIKNTDPTGHSMPTPMPWYPSNGYELWNYSNLPPIARAVIGGVVNGLGGLARADVATSTIRTPTREALIIASMMPVAADIASPVLPTSGAVLETTAVSGAGNTYEANWYKIGSNGQATYYGADRAIIKENAQQMVDSLLGNGSPEVTVVTGMDGYPTGTGFDPNIRFYNEGLKLYENYPNTS